MPCLLQADGQARAAVGLAVADKQFGEFFPQLLVGSSALAGLAFKPGVIRAAGYAQSEADFFDGIVLGHKFYEGIPPGGRSESMPMAFFRIS